MDDPTEHRGRLCPRCLREKHPRDASCSFDWLEPAGHVKVETVEGLARGTGCCQGCARADQEVYFIHVPAGQNPQVVREGHRLSTTVLYLCRPCAHKVLIDLWEILFP